MNINQTYGIVNAVAKQIYGEDFVKVVNLEGLISLGNKVLNSDTDKDLYLNSLVDRIGRTIISQRAYSSEVLDLLNDSFTFGAILQKIYVDPVEAKKAEQYDLEEGTSVDQYKISKPTVKQKLFTNRDVWEVDITIPDFQLSTAFTSAEAMTAFIDAIFTAIRNSQEIFLESMAEMCWANMIGECVVKTELEGAATVVNLREMYNTRFNKNLTMESCMTDLDFLKFASMQIALFEKKIQKMTRIFNCEGYARFTPVDKLRLTVLADFAEASAVYLQSNTYHDELVKLPQYREIVHWQGLGKKTSFEQTSKVAIRTSSGHTLVQDGVIAVMGDEEALGLTYDNRRSKSAYNNKGEYTNFFEKADMGYFNDTSENFIVFTVDKIATPTISTVAPADSVYSKAGNADVEVTMTLAAGDTYKAVNVNGTALTAEEASEAGNVVTIKKKYLAKEKTGDTIEFDIELESGALLPFYIKITA